MTQTSRPGGARPRARSVAVDPATRTGPLWIGWALGGGELAAVAELEAQILAAGGQFFRVHTDVKADRLEHGWPTDLLPAQNTPVGRMVSGRELRLQGRFDCCARSLMLPLHERMKHDGITLIVRGQRDEEYAAQPLRRASRRLEQRLSGPRLVGPVRARQVKRRARTSVG